MFETEHFVNVGYGWMCRHCRAGDETQENEPRARARFLMEGEVEEKEPRLSTPALAHWTDATRRTLCCPRCGIEELVDKT